MEGNHRPPGGEIGQQAFELSGLDGASFCGREDPLGSPLQPDGVESILKALDPKAGWVQEDESQASPAEGTLQRGEGKDESL